MALSVSPSDPTTGSLWAGAIASPAVEFPLTPLPVLAGTLPPGLQGSFYQNGPARLERQGQRVAHWLDGDGAILGLHCDGSSAVATYRYVRSAGFEEEEAAGEYRFRGYGSLPPVPLWRRWQTQVKNAANTSVLALPDRLLALWEGGWPHHLEPDSLATQGLENFDSLVPGDTFSAHPKRHPDSGDIFNFGITAGANAQLQLYRLNAAGRLQQRQTVDLSGNPLIHDFVLADRYLLFCVPPVRLNPLPAVLGLQSFSDALQWQPRRGTQLVVIDADSFEVIAWNQVDPWFQWHFGHSYLNPRGHIVMDVVRYDDFATNQQLREVASGCITTAAEAQLWQYEVNPQTAAIVSSRCLVDRHCEFPVPFLPPGAPTGSPAPTYLNLHRTVPTPQGELFQAIAQFDPSRPSLTIADVGAGRYAAEPQPVPDYLDPQRHWVLTVVYDGHRHRSEVWIYAGDHLEDGAICRLQLPQVIPPSFHGRWRQNLSRTGG
jgi:all-trans-8'-apo-beta-carotenal 15,15'-oxygenase